MLYRILACLILSVLLFGCGTSSDDPTNVVPSTTLEKIEYVINSYESAQENNSSSLLPSLVSDLNPSKNEFIADFNEYIDWCSNQDLSIDYTIVTYNITGSTVNVVVSMKSMAVDNDSFTGSFQIYNDQKFTLVSENNTIKLFSIKEPSMFDPVTGNDVVCFFGTVYRDANTGGLYIPGLDANSDTTEPYMINGMAGVSMNNQFYIFENVSSDILTITEGNDTVAVFDMSSLSNAKSTTAWQQNAASKGLDYGIVTLNLGEGYDFSNEVVTDDSSVADFMYNNKYHGGYGANVPAYYGWQDVASNGTFVKGHFMNFTVKIKNLTDVSIDPADITTNIRSSVYEPNPLQDDFVEYPGALYMVYGRNGTNYVMQTISITPLTFAWVELRQIGNEWRVE